MNRTFILIILTFISTVSFCQSIDTAIFNTNWELQRMNNKKISFTAEDQKITLILTQQNEYASGYCGCNSYVSQVVIKRKHILFREIGVTCMLCPEEKMSLERTFLSCLNDVDSYDIIDEDLYFYKNDKPILIFSKQ